jgi:CRISPR-associated protein Csy3
MSDTTKTIKLPSMLSFERKLEPSDGLMFAGNWDDETKPELWSFIPISIVKRQNRSTQSAYGITDDKKTAPNPVSSDSDDANLPIDKNTLKLSFSLRVVGNLGKPFACNKPDFASTINGKVKTFKESDNIHDLAFRYAYNIANGRFLWRNRVGAEKVKIQVHLHEGGALSSFNAYDFSLNNFDENKKNEDLKKVTEAIQNGLANNSDSSFTFIKVDAFVKLGEGQHVFPSQEMNMGEKKKKLFQLDGIAAIHNVKIGNAIRTIDTWYGDTMMIKAEGKGKTETVAIDARVPIAAEPYGSVTQHGRAYRPGKNDLYTLMTSWVNGQEIEADQQKYVVANLIRGGVFGGDSEG